MQFLKTFESFLLESYRAPYYHFTNYLYKIIKTDVDVKINIKEILPEIEDNDLIKECKRRGLFSEKKEDNIYRYLCDYFEVNYHTKKENLLKLLEKKFDFQK